MDLFAKWTISGIVTERRELTSKKSETWRAYVFKIATLGATFEIQCSPEQYKDIIDGQQVICDGRFEEQGGHQRLVLINISDASASAKKGGA